MQTLEQQLQGAQDALQKKDLEVQVCKVEFDARSAEERLRFASEIKARNEELLALRVDRDDCVRQWAAEKSAMQEEIKARLFFFPAPARVGCSDARRQVVAAKLRTSSRRTAELEVALKEHVEQEGSLHAQTAQLEEKLTQATETFREKLHKCRPLFVTGLHSCMMRAQVHIRRGGVVESGGKCRKQRV